MNRRKIAIFVEGDTELVFVRNFLNTWYNYDANSLGVECYKLHSNQPNPVPYTIGSRESENFYQLIIVGNDNIVSKVLSRAEVLGKAGFSSIIGLRDMYCDTYHKHSFQGRTVSSALNDQFKQMAQTTIDNSQLPNKSDIHIHFAIMEVESWLLGMERLLAYIDSRLDMVAVKEQIGLDMLEDPEETIYHPAYKLEQLFALAGKQYGKHTDVAEHLLSQLVKADYEQLYHSGKCSSFHEFVDLII